MSTPTKTKKPRFTTPRGVAVFPHLDKPDTKFAKEGEEGKYSVKLRLRLDEARPLIDQLNAEMAASLKEAIADPANKGKAKQADPPYQIDEESGTVTVTFKSKLKPALFDATPKPIEAEVWGGSEIKVNFCIGRFFTKLVGAGVTLYLNAVQVLQLRTRGMGGDAGAYGFQGDDEGYQADNAPAKADGEALEPKAEGAASADDF